jgi:O-Antigen ligase/Tetratricopeptide repeat
VESHVAASTDAPTRTLEASRANPAGLFGRADVVVSLLLAAALAAAAFVANGGLQLGSATLVEEAAIAVAAVVVAGAVLVLGLSARLHGGVALAGMVALGALTMLSIAWSLHPADSWVEANRTIAYVATFACGIAAVRIARGRWPAILAGVLLALAAVSLYALATKVAPGWLAEHETYGRLREPYGYWNAVGITAAMAMPLCLWLGTRTSGRQGTNALAWPLLGLLLVTMLLSFSRGSIAAAAIAVGLWFAFVPLRLRSLAVLLPAAIGAAAVTAWAFSQSALTDDNIALTNREDAGAEFGLILVATAVLLFAVGIAIQRRSERHPLSERARRRVGMAALATLAAVPVIALGALALSDRGIGGTVSDRWHDLTQAEAVTPQNTPGRLTETSSVRSIYWRRAVDVWEEDKLAGAGAGSFAQAQLRFRKEQARGKHAHGYVLQTMADLGLIGLGVSLAALAAWLLAVGTTLGVRRRSGWEWTPERYGLTALALVAIAFGVHSALDWTWFVPAVAMTGLFCAGWVAGRGSIAARAQTRGPAPLETVTASVPDRRTLKRRLPVAIAVLALAVLAAVPVAAPWRAREEGDEALRLVSSGDYGDAQKAAERARDLNSLSPEPYFELAAVENATGDRQAARSLYEQAVRVEPANAETWQRLGDYLLVSLDDPASAIPVLRGALYLDPLSQSARASLVVALRAEQLKTTDEPRRRVRP